MSDKSGNAESWCRHALQLAAVGQREQAIAAYRRAIELDPNYFQAHNNLGTLLSAMGRIDDAMAAYRNALRCKSDYLPALTNLGNSLYLVGKTEDAIQVLRRALQIHPTSAEAHFGLGYIMAETGKLDEAIFHYAQAVRLKDDYAKAWNNFGAALKDAGRLEEALAACRRAISLDGSRADFFSNLAGILKANGQLDASYGAYAQALKITPDWAEAHWNLGLLLLLRGDFKRGWEEFEWRWQHEIFVAGHNQFPQPRWKGEPLSGRTILLHAEQGYGDTIQFIRYAEAVADRGGRVVVLCPPELSRLLRNAARVSMVKDAAPLPAFDVHCPLMSLPPLFGGGLDSIPRKIPYLHVLPELMEKWSRKLGPRDGRLRVGLCWSGRPTHKSDRTRSIAPSKMSPLASVQGVAFYSLQKWAVPGQHAPIPMIDLTADIHDFADTAALVSQLDLVISVDTAVAHLAGALGKPVWILLPWVPDWRWLLGRDDSPWYPTARLFRQSRAGDWADAINRVVQELAATSRSGEPSRTSSSTPIEHKSPARLAGPTGFAAGQVPVPDSAEEMNDRAIALAMKGQVQEAIPLFRAAVAAKPLSPEFHNNLANALKSVGHIQEAIAEYREALRLKPNYAEAHSNLGVALGEDAQYEQSIAMLRRAIELMPNNAQAYNNLGSVLADDGQTEEAIETYHAALKIKPDYADAMSNLGNALSDKGEFAQALAFQERALALNPGAPEIHNNLGNSLKYLRRLDEAIAAYHRALRINPNYIEAHKNLAIALMEKGDADAAIEMYRRGLRLAPDWAEGHWNLALTLLGQGKFEEGWNEFEWRWRWKKFPSPRRDFAQPLWDGSNLGGRTILLHYEQGFGDTLQFIRYAPLVAKRGGRVVFLCRPELARLLKCIDGIAEIATELPQYFDVHCPLMSLPRLFATRLETIPAEVPYITAEPADAETWRRRVNALAPSPPYSGERVGVRGAAPAVAGRETSNVSPLTPALSPEYRGEGGGKLRVGLCWAGISKHQNDRYRSITLQHFVPLSRAKDAIFFSLQKGEPASQIARLAEMKLIDLTIDLHDFADTAALIANLDLVIAVDTAVAHLAGAMGKPAWVLLPANADWRWLCGREDSPWYPTMRLFRQQNLGEWGPVIERVATELEISLVTRASRPCAPSTGAQMPSLEKEFSNTSAARMGETPMSQAKSYASHQQFTRQIFQTAVAHHTAGRIAEAASGYEQILAFDPNHVDALHLLGVAKARMGDQPSAIGLIERAIALHPTVPEFHRNLANAWGELNQFSNAVPILRNALRLRPGDIATMNSLGIALIEIGQAEEAVGMYEQILSQQPGFSEAYYHYGNALTRLGKLENAVRSYRRAIELAPRFAEAHHGLAIVLSEQRQADDALTEFNKAIELKPTLAAAHCNLGTFLVGLGRVEEALASIRRAEQLDPKSPTVHCALGVTFKDLGRIDDAVDACRRAIEIDPQCVRAHSNLGMILLLRGDLEEGWRENEWRWKLKDFGSVRRAFKQPRWDGSSLKARRILLYAEQGFGDTIQFMRYIPMVQAAGGHVIFECHVELARLLRGVLNCEMVVNGEKLPEFDVECPLMSLPYLFGTTLQNIPASPRVRASRDLVEQWGRKMPEKKEGLRIGLTWAGNPQHSRDNARSLQLEKLQPLMKKVADTFFSLQKGGGFPALPSGLDFVDFTAEFHDFADTAAMIEHLDLVISVDTAVAHLAGAMGKPVWVLLPFDPDWRWMLGREDSPWYPTMRLFRQTARWDWTEVIERVVDALSTFNRK